MITMGIALGGAGGCAACGGLLRVLGGGVKMAVLLVRIVADQWALPLVRKAWTLICCPCVNTLLALRWDSLC